MLSEENLCAFSDALRACCRGETGDWALSTKDRFEKREDDDDGREKLRIPAGAGEGAKSRSASGVFVRGGSGGFSEGLSCGHAVCESAGKSSPICLISLPP